MTRPRKPLLSVSIRESNVQRCLRAVVWVSRRVNLELQTRGTLKVVGKGRNAKVVPVGKPLLTLPLLEVIRETGLEGVPPSTESAQERVRSSWAELTTHWSILRREPQRFNHADVTELIVRTNRWIDETLAPQERKRLQAFFRQRTYRERTSPQVVQVPIPRELYEELTEGLSRVHRKSYLIELLRWAAERRLEETALRRDIGVTDAAQITGST